MIKRNKGDLTHTRHLPKVRTNLCLWDMNEIGDIPYPRRVVGCFVQ